jgi:Fe-S-cluster-containing dehydrogenase component
MKKCTLCIDRIYNENLEESERKPACVIACPAGARHFGDLGDSDSDISRLVERRGGYALMPESGYQPVNRYLPPRPRKDRAGDTGTSDHLDAAEDVVSGDTFFKWLDKALSR